jgi:hypothetical protein
MADQQNKDKKEVKKEVKEVVDKKEVKKEDDIIKIKIDTSEDEIMYDLTLNDLHANLIIISNIQPGQKLIVTNNLLSIDNRYISNFFRWQHGDDRIKTIKFVNTVIDKTFAKIAEIKSDMKYVTNSFETQNSILQRFNNELKNSLKGLTNLKTTYSTDASASALLDVMIENISNMINNITISLKM